MRAPNKGEVAEYHFALNRERRADQGSRQQRYVAMITGGHGRVVGDSVIVPAAMLDRVRAACAISHPGVDIKSIGART